MTLKSKKIAFVAAGVVALTAIATPQLGRIIKVVGVGAAVKQFGPQINKEINKLTKHTDTYSQTTKVVPILSLGLNASTAIGAAQVTGPKNKVEQVQAVAQPEANILGNEVRIKALIPVSSTNVIQSIKRVDGVGVSGIVDLKV